ncbi:MAG: MoxR family ATPase [Porticoccaceae bacterium]|nr:MoxR family ATPase [Pseudomonadales bacterium]MCP5171729.1 MoxR family ATPase [Pseudomonadales bacterium]
MQKVIETIIGHVSQVLIGKEQQVKLSLACLFARGHLLIEDLPGMGKTTLAHGLASVLGLSYQRIQFTSDLLPADVIGVSVFNRDKSEFEFHPGPVFSQLLLADEINRTTPKTQSALLEAMAEGQVTVDGETRPLPQPFFVIATQNPVNQAGTFPLPESQLDRFLMRIELGYPDPASERQILSGTDPRKLLQQLKPLISPEQLTAIQNKVDTIKASEALIDYLQRLIQHTREAPVFHHGLSPRGALAVLQGARAWALIHGRGYTIPEDIQAVFPAVAGHRLRVKAELAEHSDVALAEQVLGSVDIL